MHGAMGEGRHAGHHLATVGTVGRALVLIARPHQVEDHDRFIIDRLQPEKISNATLE